MTRSIDDCLLWVNADGTLQPAPPIRKLRRLRSRTTTPSRIFLISIKGCQYAYERWITASILAVRPPAILVARRDSWVEELGVGLIRAYCLGGCRGESFANRSSDRHWPGPLEDG